MKVKTSVTLSEDIARQIARVTRKGESRSQTIERLVREGLAKRRRREVEQRDLAIINAHIDELTAEAEDVLDYQARV
jgi:metal-responsive CopG/Arc/MetJ family transcriptional regulator